MKISNERLEEIRHFKNTDFSDCPVLTDEQLAQMKPCHLNKVKGTFFSDEEDVAVEVLVEEKIPVRR